VPDDGGRSRYQAVDYDAVVGVADIAAVVSYEHASALVRAHGRVWWTARLIPLAVDGLTYSSSVARSSAVLLGAP
jgi:hypothetical protein